MNLQTKEQCRHHVDESLMQKAVREAMAKESRNFLEHGHSVEGCDTIVCWRHNWPECPAHLEVVELSQIIQSLPGSDE